MVWWWFCYYQIPMHQQVPAVMTTPLKMMTTTIQHRPVSPQYQPPLTSAKDILILILQISHLLSMLSSRLMAKMTIRHPLDPHYQENTVSTNQIEYLNHLDTCCTMNIRPLLSQNLRNQPLQPQHQRPEIMFVTWHELTSLIHRWSTREAKMAIRKQLPKKVSLFYAL